MTKSKSEKTKNSKKGFHDGDRVAKVMAAAGLCSRREAERWIEAGRVQLNGQKLTSPAQNVKSSDQLVVDGKPISLEKKAPRVWRYHKPPGLVTSHSDEKGRKTVFDAMPEQMPRVISVGRLDMTTEGLLLLTNDGDLARYMELPSTGWKRRYRVRAHGHYEAEKFEKLASGITIEGIHYASIDVEFERQQGDNFWLTLGLREGKNREIRTVMEHLGYPVNRLIRLSYGPFQLGKLPRGAIEEVTGKVLKEQMADYFKQAK